MRPVLSTMWWSKEPIIDGDTAKCVEVKTKAAFCNTSLTEQSNCLAIVCAESLLFALPAFKFSWNTIVQHLVILEYFCLPK